MFRKFSHNEKQISISGIGIPLIEQDERTLRTQTVIYPRISIKTIH
jgi:hypothetical protein